MNTYMFAAGVLAVLVSVAHSVLGEILVFRRVRSGGIVPAVGAPPLRARHVRILWASWHLATVFGCGTGLILLRLAWPIAEPSLQMLVRNAVMFAFLGGSLLVLIGTRGRHPGWIGLLAVALLAWNG